VAPCLVLHHREEEEEEEEEGGERFMEKVEHHVVI
jgi:hypothetical protein